MSGSPLTHLIHLPRVFWRRGVVQVTVDRLFCLKLCIFPATDRYDTCRFETARVDNGIVLQRPVIRLEGGVVLTRIKPGNMDTSMIMRIRPGWDALRAFLASPAQGQPGGKSVFFFLSCCQV